MSIDPGTRIGPYEVVAALGKGGMGEVYRARDTKLGREVALKILPVQLGADPDRRARFEREARTLAALNHPHIAQLYGFEDSGSIHALVMELVEGPTLADRLAANGRFDAREAVSVAGQIASALEAAHDAGVIHRDLKPANVKVREDGTVKVLDFGLAKAIEGDASLPRPQGQSAPTMTSPAVTELGVILGTAAYMSPEQASGRPVDKRADIWAFGVVLYEMLTGRRLFGGDTVAETLASVIKDAPALDGLPASTPAHVRRVLARCLERDPKLRLRDIGEARYMLAHPEPAEPAPARVTGAHRAVWATAAAGILLAAAVGVVARRLTPSAVVPVRRVELPAAIAAGSDLALAPDGSAIAYLASGHLYVRDLEALDSRDLGPTPTAANTLFWSPDSRSIGFAAAASLRSIPAAGGSAFEICRIPATGRVMGAAWLANGTIVFSVWRDSLYQVPATGGAPAMYLAVDPATEIDFHTVAPRPDGRLIIATHRRKEDTERAEITDGRTRVVLASDGSIRDIRTVSPDRVLFLRVGANQGLWTAPFSGGAIDVASAVLVQPGVDAYDVAGEGTLIYRVPAPVMSSLVWLDRSGKVSSVPGAPIQLSTHDLALSPDGRRVAFVTGTQNAGGLVVRDLQTGADTPLIVPRSGDDASSFRAVERPDWFPTGDRIAYSAGAVESSQIMTRRADGSMEATALTAGFTPRLSPDGRTLLFLVDDRGRGRLRHARLQPDGSLGPSQPFFHDRTDAEPNVNFMDLSPDGAMLAVAAIGADGQSNIFVTEFPGAKERWIVTTQGGARPRFSPDGRELFYLTGTRDAQGHTRGELMRRPVTLHPTVTLGAPSMLLEESNGGIDIGGFDVSRDGRFLVAMRTARAAGEGAQLVLVQNWIAAIHK